MSACAQALGWALAATLLGQLMLAFSVQGQVQADEHFGIGFDLTPAYGTAAVSYANGSNLPLARVDGDAAWREMMCSSAEDSNLQHGCSPSHISANSTVDVLASMVRLLRAAAESQLGVAIPAASATLPGAHWTRITNSIIKEAFREADIEYLQIAQYGQWGEPLIFPENSVLAGHKIGLCHPYTSPHTCLHKGNPDLPCESYYFVGYYGNEIEVTTTSDVYGAYSVNPYPFVDFHLGAEMRHRNPDESYYWEEVRKFLSKPMIQFSWRKPSKVILYGDRSGEPRLRDTVMEVLKSWLKEEEMPDWIDDGLNATFVGAMGAAEFAKRKPFWDADGSVADELVVQPKRDL